MTAIQLVFDSQLLKEIDRQAKKQALSRSEFVRNSMRQTLERLDYLEAVEQERRAYARLPETKSERAARRAMNTRVAKVLDTSGGDW